MLVKPRTLSILAVAFAVTFLLGTLFLAPVAEAQIGGTATPTPNSPLWRAYAAARDAIQDETGENLASVRSYTYEQTEFINGIDDCVELDNPAAARPVYFGWTFTIIALDGETYQSRVSFDLQNVSVCDEVVTSAASTTTTTTTTAVDPSLPAPVAGAASGGSFELGGHVLEVNTSSITIAKSAGMIWIKKQVYHQEGANAGDLAGTISTAHANGMKILLGVVGDKNALTTNFDGYVANFSSYLAGLASFGADAIEVWNEPNIDREWPAGQINGANYTRMLASASNAIRNASAKTLVISGAPAPTGYFGAAGCTANGCNDDVFMQQMAAAGAGQYIDCVGLHYNEGIVSPSTVGGDKRGEYPTYYFQSMTQRGYSPFGGKPVCYTELGYLSGQGFSQAIPSNFGWAADITVAQQAAWLAEAATISKQLGYVRLMIVWNVDFPYFTATDPMGGYAIRRPDGTCPSCTSLKTVMGG